MIIFLFVIPLLALMALLYTYNNVGRRHLFRFDLVQFLYAFVISPIMFVWAKSFLFVILRGELGVSFGPTELFILDTLFSVGFLYIFAFVVIHSLTKTIELNKKRHISFDVFKYTEHFHNWTTHYAMYIGAMTLVVVLALANVVVPFEVEMTKFWFYFTIGSGLVAGVGYFLAVWNSFPRDNKAFARFIRVMKLSFALFFTVLAAVFFLISPSFSPIHLVYWWAAFSFFAAVALFLFAERSQRVESVVDRIVAWIKER